ncbi:hypothetical protein DMENIID0001_082910 [Sergentomyia squamirostris]
MSSLETTRIILKSCLVAVGNSMTIEMLEKDYFQNEGEKIPCGRFGFRTTEDFLRSLSDLVRVTGHGRSAIVTLLSSKHSKTQHIESMVSAQKPNKKFKEHFARSSGRSGMNRSHGQRLQWQPRDCMPVQKNQPQNQYAATQMVYMMNNNYFIPSSVLRQNASVRVPVVATPVVTSGNSKEAPVQHSQVQPVRRVPEKPKSPPRKERTPSPELVPEMKLSNPFEEFSETWLESQMPNVVAPPGYGRKIISPRKISPEPEISTNNNEEISTEITRNIERLDCFSQGTPPMQSTGSDDSQEDPGATGGDSDPALPDWVYKDLQTVPTDMAGYRDKIYEPVRSDVLPMDTWTEMYITEVHNIHKFYFHVNTDVETINHLMESLKNFYSKPSSNELTLQLHEMKINLPVAAPYMGIWHRARIITDPFYENKEPVIKVFYVDFGTVSTISTGDLRFLHKNFLRHHQFCHRGSLAGLLPEGESWSCESTIAFLKLVSHCMLYARPNHFYVPDRSWHVEVVKADRKPHININIELNEKDMARMYNDEDLEDYMQFYRTHAPDFIDLETGHYPTFLELQIFQRAGIECNLLKKQRTYSDESVEDNVNEPGLMEMEEDKVEEEPLYIKENNPFLPNLLKDNIKVVIISCNEDSSIAETIFEQKMNISSDNFNFSERKKISNNPSFFYHDED